MPGQDGTARRCIEGRAGDVEFEPQTRIEGDIQQLPANFPVVGLWRVLSGEVAGRESDAQVTVFDSVGFALEDFSALRYLRDVSDAHNIGEQIELIGAPANPKDLYQFVVPVSLS